MKFRYKTENAELFDDARAYLSNEASGETCSEGWINYFYKRYKTPFARVNLETKCIELAHFTDKGVITTVKRKLRIEIRGGDLQ